MIGVKKNALMKLMVLHYGFGNNTKEQFEEWFGQAIELTKYEGKLQTTRKIYCIEENKIYDSAEQLIREWNLTRNSDIYIICNHKKRSNNSYYKSIKFPIPSKIVS